MCVHEWVSGVSEWASEQWVNEWVSNWATEWVSNWATEWNEFWNVDTTNIVDIFKDRIFCTDQEIDQMDNLYYDINQGQYITDNSYNNDYIVIWKKEKEIV